jgi:AcrR family transcriptional regulator
MSPEQRREMIVAATLPLVIQHGAAVTTAQVARAAGIGEGTIFRVFPDKDALLAACVAEALRPDNALASLAEISLEQSLHDRLVEAADALQAHMDRVGAVIGALFASGHGRDPRTDPAATHDQAREPGAGRTAAMTATVAAVAELFTPEAGSLRWPPERLAGTFLSLLLHRNRPPGEPGQQLDPPELIELFLHGALR